MVISTFLVEYSALVPVALLLVAATCVAVGHVVLRASHGQSRILWMLVVLSMLPVIVLTLVPTSNRGDDVTCAIQFYVPTLGSVELLANVALFIPPVFFATLATRRPLLTLAAGASASASIETLQAVVPRIGRACDTSDWAMNTTGTVAAILLAGVTIMLTNRIAARKARKGDAQNSLPHG